MLQNTSNLSIHLKFICVSIFNTSTLGPFCHWAFFFSFSFAGIIYVLGGVTLVSIMWKVSIPMLSSVFGVVCLCGRAEYIFIFLVPNFGIVNTKDSPINLMIQSDSHISSSGIFKTYLFSFLDHNRITSSFLCLQLLILIARRHREFGCPSGCINLL